MGSPRWHAADLRQSSAATKQYKSAVKHTSVQSGSQPLVTMMETANLWKSDYLTGFDGLDRPWHGAVLAQRKVSPRPMIIVQIRSENAPQVLFVQDDEVVKTFSPTRASRPAAQPITRSAQRFCHGERGVVTTSSMFMALILARTTNP